MNTTSQTLGAPLAALALVVASTACNDLTAGRCPRGAELVGAKPPLGLVLYCNGRDSSGNQVKVGLQEIWWPDGTKKLETHFDQGVVGDAIGWYPNGSKAIEKKEQITTLWYNNGAKEGEIGGEPGNGTVRIWYPSGAIASDAKLADAKGLSTLYYEDGAVLAKVPINGGKTDGETNFFAKDGSLIARLNFAGGVQLKSADDDKTMPRAAATAMSANDAVSKQFYSDLASWQ